ncbi:hypothetical protein ACHWQZ_G013199 [Mnemiopsis leidyi]
MSALSERTADCFNNHYRLLKLIGQGGYGKVWLCYRLCDNKLFAAKRVLDSKCRRKTWCVDREVFLPDEVVLWEGLDHPNIIRLEEVFSEHDSWIFVMEYGEEYLDLFSYMELSGGLSETESAGILRQIVDVCEYLITEEVDHRDIKDENILYNPSTQQIKLIDFGSASFLEPDRRYHNLQGTEVYIPPELYNQGSYCPESGLVWSIGCLAYVLVHGDVPFNNRTQVMEFKHVSWMRADVGPVYRDFVERCLQRFEILRTDFYKLKFHPLLKVKGFFCG